MEPGSPLSTPKRKRSQFASDDIPNLNTTKFSFHLHDEGTEDGSNSPRTKVAHKFRGLDLTGGSGDEGRGNDTAAHRGGATPASEPKWAASHGDPASLKRIKLPEAQETIRATVETNDDTAESAEAGIIVDGEWRGEWASGLQATVDSTIPRTAKSGGGGLRRSYPSINRLADSKSRRKRTGTPPLVGAKTNANSAKRAPTDGDPAAYTASAFCIAEEGEEDEDGDDDDDEVAIVDPVRAALTWHDDEITVYDPEDEDDDGTGINGIGFRPTPAIAHARVLKRRQQLAEYKKREDREARNRRSQRRRGSPELNEPPPHGDVHDGEGAAATRRVHFMEVEPSAMVTI